MSKRKKQPKPERKARAGTITGVECLKTDWQTPRHLVEAVAEYFGGRIPLDVATAGTNPTGARYFYAPGDHDPLAARRGDSLWLGPDGLGVPWQPPARPRSDRNARELERAAALGDADAEAQLRGESWGAFCNPPYGRVLRNWLTKIRAEALAGCVVIALLPCARWEQGYFTDVLRAANAVCYVRKRVAFVNPATGDAVGGNPYANMFLGFNVAPWRWRSAFGDLGACFELRAL